LAHRLVKSSLSAKMLRRVEVTRRVSGSNAATGILSSIQ
jgi:hypothetical protein